MRFLHTADLHYGATPDAKRPWGKERAQAVKKCFARVISACKNDGIDMLLIAGGLFDGRPTQTAIREVNDAFASIPDTQVYVVAGANDFGFKWAPNVKYTSGNNLEITDYRILLRCDDEVDEDELPSGYNYIALGGSHKTRIYKAGKAVNAGSPEPLGPADTGKHGYYVGEIGEKLTSLKYYSLPTTKYITLVANVTQVSTCNDVKENLRAEMKRRGEKNIYTIKIRGTYSPDVTFNLDELKYDFRVDEIINLAEARYDYVQIFKDHPSDMVGFFVKEMNTEDKSELQKKALNYGVDALLKTADERL